MADTEISRNYKLTAELDAAPLRSLDDFLLGSARFQLPQFNDVNRWTNRITSNLLYYQTNYFVLMAGLFLIFCMLNPRDMLISIVCVGIILGIAIYVTTNHPRIADVKRDYPLVGLGVMLLGVSVCFTMIGSVMIFLFAVAFPVFITLAHASLRLRNLKNKIANKAEAAGVTKTVMGRILEIAGFKQEFIRVE